MITIPLAAELFFNQFFQASQDSQYLLPRQCWRDYQYYLSSAKRSLALQQCNQARDSRSKATNVAGPVVKYARPIKLNMPNVFQSTLGVLQCLKN